jgi:hypothetical protein
MAALPPNFNTQFFTNEGVPAAGYLLHTYDTGTTTPKATFTTQAGDVSNANPIVLDSDGPVLALAGLWRIHPAPQKPPPLRW